MGENQAVEEMWGRETFRKVLPPEADSAECFPRCWVFPLLLFMPVAARCALSNQ